MEQEAVFFCLFCACSDGTSKEAVFFCLFSVSIFRSPCSAPHLGRAFAKNRARIFKKALGQESKEEGVSKYRWTIPATRNPPEAVRVMMGGVAIGG